MRIRTLINVLLILGGVLCVISTLKEWTEVEFYVKPTIVPMLFILYWFNTRKVDFVFLIILLLCFIGDVFTLLEFDDSFLYVLLSYTVAYFFMYHYGLKEFFPISLSLKEVTVFILFSLIWTYTIFEIFFAIQNKIGDLKILSMVYCINMYMLFGLAFLKFMNKRTKFTFWFLIAVFSFVICDAATALNKFNESNFYFQLLNAIFQLLAVYFLIRFRLSQEQYNFTLQDTV